MARETVETSEYLSACKRFLRAAGKRVADSDEFELAELLALQDDLDAAVQAGVDGILASGRSWADIATATGKSRQAAFKRWGKK